MLFAVLSERMMLSNTVVAAFQLVVISCCVAPLAGILTPEDRSHRLIGATLISGWWRSAINPPAAGQVDHPEEGRP